jgi:hypothetical protein
MFSIFTDRNSDEAETLLALEQAREMGDVSQVPVIIEISRFYGGAAIQTAMTRTLEELTGASFGGAGTAWDDWMVWLGKNAADFRPPEGYVDWKANLYGLIDPRMAVFFEDAFISDRIDLTEVAWGGVVTDGIQDLQNPPVVRPQDTDFFLPGDRVFGVSINGEHRAYPLRIINAHEMANDVLGGEPIALAY